MVTARFDQRLVVEGFDALRQEFPLFPLRYACQHRPLSHSQLTSLGELLACESGQAIASKIAMSRSPRVAFVAVT